MPELTVCVTGGEVLVVKFPSPLYTAVRLWVPTLNDEIGNVATPEAFSVTVPRVVAPSLNVTVPVGVPIEEVTIDVNVTAWPYVDGFSEEESAVELVALLTVCTSADEVLPAQLASPLYTSVRLWLPALSAEVDNVATPEAFSVAVPRDVAPSWNVTVPVHHAGLTVAVHVTGLP